jgi:hypothetical protein
MNVCVAVSEEEKGNGAKAKRGSHSSVATTLTAATGKAKSVDTGAVSAAGGVGTGAGSVAGSVTLGSSADSKTKSEAGTTPKDKVSDLHWR